MAHEQPGCRADQSGQVLPLAHAHAKELLLQSVDKLRQVCPELRVRIYSTCLSCSSPTAARYL